MRLSSSAIYKILNKVTADFYIGSAVNFSTRRSVHIHRLNRNQHHSPILQNAWNKYGAVNFEFTMIELVEDKTKLIEREQFYIDTLKPKYNCHLIAGSALGVKHTKESRLNMSKAHKCLTKEQRGHKIDCICCICKRPTGKDSYRYIAREKRFCICGCGTEFEIPTTSSKKYISGHNGSRRGKKNSEIQVKNHVDFLKNHYKENPQHNAIKIIQLTSDDKEVKIWVSINEASRKLKIGVPMIKKCLNENFTYKGFKFIYG